MRRPNVALDVLHEKGKKALYPSQIKQLQEWAEYLHDSTEYGVGGIRFHWGYQLRRPAGDSPDLRLIATPEHKPLETIEDLGPVSSSEDVRGRVEEYETRIRDEQRARRKGMWGTDAYRLPDPKEAK